MTTSKEPAAVDTSIRPLLAPAVRRARLLAWRQIDTVLVDEERDTGHMLQVDAIFLRRTNST